MNTRITLTGAQTKYLRTNYRGGPLSLVCVPVSGTYSVEFTCTPDFLGTTPVADASKNWVPVSSGLTGATVTQTAETGSITGLKFVLTSGTSLTVDICQAET